MEHEISIFPITWRTPFTMFKPFSSLYISHNLIHNIQPIHSLQNLGSPRTPPPTLILHLDPLFAKYFQSLKLIVLHCARSWRRIQEKIITATMIQPLGSIVLVLMFSLFSLQSMFLAYSIMCNKTHRILGMC